jgi:hypothetical protein
MKKDSLIVSSHFREDVSWLDDSDFPYLVVSKGDDIPQVRNYSIIPNRGLEFGSYIWYLLSHWDNLPEKIAFVHGHRDAYHQQFPIDQSIRNLCEAEFASLNGEFSLAIHRLDGEHPWFSRNFRSMWDFLGLNSVCSSPSVAAIQPSTQCVISRNILKSRGRSFWERIFYSIMSHEAHYHLALVMEVAWPIIFGMNPENNPFVVDEFRSFFDRKNLSVFIAHPKEVWHSSMPNTVKFEVPESRESWVSSCINFSQEFAKVY